MHRLYTRRSRRIKHGCEAELMRRRAIYTMVAKSSICDGREPESQCRLPGIARTLVRSGAVKMAVRSKAMRTAVRLGAVRVTAEQERRRLINGSRDNGHSVIIENSYCWDLGIRWTDLDAEYVRPRTGAPVP